MKKIIDGISFNLKTDFDFYWISKYGKVFCVFAEQDSGNICFGMVNDNKRVFIKVAGASTR
jgi:serine/threonine-protein kinase